MILAEIFPYAHQVFVGLNVLYMVTAIGIICVVLSENRNPVKSLAWITVLLLLPVVAAVEEVPVPFPAGVQADSPPHSRTPDSRAASARFRQDVAFMISPSFQYGTVWKNQRPYS